MSDNTTTVVPAPTTPKKEKPDLSKVACYTITRNEIPLVLTPFAGTRGKWDGTVYQAPQIEIEGATVLTEDSTFIKGLIWFGKDNLKRIVNIFARRMAQDIWEDSIPEAGDQEGIWQEATFIRLMTEFAASSMKISELQELYEDAVAKYQNASGPFIVEMTTAAAETDEKKRAELTKAASDKFKGLSDAVSSIRAELETRRAKRSKEAATETVTPE